MKLHFKKLTGKVGFVVAVAGAAVIGGVSTGVVMASIPDSSGNLNTCYRNNGGDLRVIDTATESCSNHETAFNLSQTVTNSSTAYFRVKNGSVDTSALRNIANYEWYDGTGITSSTGYCIQASFTPSIGVGSNTVGTSVNLRNYSNNDSDTIDEHCASNYNAFVPSGNEFDDIAAWFSK